MYYAERDGKKVAKGMKMVLEERGLSTAGKTGDWMRQTVGQHSNFRDKKSMIEHMLILAFCHVSHPELNPIDRVWAQLKQFTKAHCNYSLPSLHKNIPLESDSVTVENIRNHFHKVHHYMFCYFEGLSPGKELDQESTKLQLNLTDELASTSNDIRIHFIFPLL